MNYSLPYCSKQTWSLSPPKRPRIKKSSLTFSSTVWLEKLFFFFLQFFKFPRLCPPLLSTHRESFGMVRACNTASRIPYTFPSTSRRPDLRGPLKGTTGTRSKSMGAQVD